MNGAVAERIGFSKEQMLEIRANDIQFDNKLKTVAALARKIAVTKNIFGGVVLLVFVVVKLLRITIEKV